ncbi:hypothetical protein LJC30_06775 [Odoribacter sp. OttesenSCG-928-L07]|nr:hypothetical protein [Odoribacter sp. OttesenSCG-928-L07]
MRFSPLNMLLHHKTIEDLPHLDEDILSTIRKRSKIINQFSYPDNKYPSFRCLIDDNFFSYRSLLSFFPSPPVKPRNPKPIKPELTIIYDKDIPDGKNIRGWVYNTYWSGGCAIVLCFFIIPIIWAILFGVYSATKEEPTSIFANITIFILALILGFAIILLIISVFDWEWPIVKSDNKYKKYTIEEKENIKKSMIEDELKKYEEKLKRYQQDLTDYENYNEKYKALIEQYNIEFETWQKKLNKNYISIFNTEFYNWIRKINSTNFTRSKNNPKKGYSENTFFIQLYNLFPDKIKIDTCLEYYFPDITIKINNVLIDIEIDEPYDYITKQEIHYLDDDGISIDEKRDEYFLENNWFVLKFTERQIVKQKSICVEIVKCIVDFIESGNIDYLEKYLELSTIIKEKKWTKEDARAMVIMNVRDDY